MGTAFLRLNTGDFNNVWMPVPPLPEQRIIAGYLDQETARIDGLVERLERLIALLTEKRQAVISHAVTKGLEPSAPMKDSGIDWLGEVPAHWEVKRVKNLSARIIDCLHETPDHDDIGDYPSIRTADVKCGVLDLTNAKWVTADEYTHRIQRLKPLPGDIVYNREGERFGLAAVIPEGVEICLGQRMMMFRVWPFVLSRFFMWAINGDFAYKFVRQFTMGATSPHLNISDVRNIPIPLPPITEQVGVVSFIDGETNEIDQAIEGAERLIASAIERRAALISAAVTGEISLAEMTPHAEAAE